MGVIPMERILVVDDEIHVVRLLQKYFTSKGYEVHTATNGREAIQKVKDMRPQTSLISNSLEHNPFGEKYGS